VAQKGIRDGCARLQDTATRLPVYYDPTEFGVRWEIGKVGTNIQHMMVEFPVPPEQLTDEAPSVPNSGE